MLIKTIKYAIGVDIFNLAAKSDLMTLKAEIDIVDIS